MRQLIVALCLIALPSARAYAQSSSPGMAEGPELSLSLRQAIDMALAPDGNTRVALAVQMVEEARSRSDQSRAALLPQLNSSISQQSIVRNLEALGVRFSTVIPGLQIPSVVGPFNVFDARVTAGQSVFDMRAIRRFQASRLAVRATREQELSTRERVMADVARAYMAALRAQQQVETALADGALADRLLDLTKNRKDAGSVAGLEVARAEVEAANARQIVLVRRQEQRAAQLQLSRLIGVDLATTLHLTTALDGATEDGMTVSEAFAEALENRADWKAQQQRVESLRRSYSAVKWESMPSVSAFADYGTIGSNINHAQPTRTIGGSVQVPLFDGGRRGARRGESAVQLRQEEIRAQDLREQIELELRLAADSLASSASQLEVAEQGLRQAEAELGHAERRYRSGVSGSLEVTDAQARLARARQNRIDALFALNLARIDWGEARGRIETVIP